MDSYVYIKSASVFYHRYNKKYYLKVNMTGGGMAVTTLENIDSELSRTIMKKANFNPQSMVPKMNNYVLYLKEPVCHAGIVFKAHVPPMYKYDDGPQVDTVEGFYCHNEYPSLSLKQYVYDKIRRVMRYRIFTNNEKGEKLFRIPERKDLQFRLLEFYTRTRIDRDDFGGGEVSSDITREEESEIYTDYVDSVFERFNVGVSIYN